MALAWLASLPEQIPTGIMIACDHIDAHTRHVLQGQSSASSDEKPTIDAPPTSPNKDAIVSIDHCPVTVNAGPITDHKTGLASAPMAFVALYKSLEFAYAAGVGEHAARTVLEFVVGVLQQGHDALPPWIKEAYVQAAAAADAVTDWARDHPVYATAIGVVLALGVLVILAPVTLSALGFSAVGPVQGSFAAGWQSTYGAAVPAGSLFAYLQSLGMTIARRDEVMLARL